MTGELTAAAPVARQVREVVLRVEQVEPGVLRVSAPAGWCGGLARNPVQLAQLVSQAFRESQVLAYARWRRTAYTVSGEQRKRRRTRRDVHSPADWKVDREGLWIDPGAGRRWSNDSQVVRRVMARREQMGLDPIPDGVDV